MLERVELYGVWAFQVGCRKGAEALKLLRHRQIRGRWVRSHAGVIVVRRQQDPEALAHEVRLVVHERVLQ